MNLIENQIEEGEQVDIKNLESGFIDSQLYQDIHEKSIICCHDVAIKMKNEEGETGIVMVHRENFPHKEFWLLGGRVQRGVEVIESLRQKVRAECSLELKDIEYIGTGRTMARTDPFGHGKGTDTMNLVYEADGVGEIKLDDVHTQPIILTKKDYTEEFKKGLSPYTIDILDRVFKKI